KRTVFVIVLLLAASRATSAQPLTSATTTTDESTRCTEESCTREFEFLYVDPEGNGGIGRVSLLVERNSKLFKVPVVGFYEEHYGGLGDQWRSSAWLAATYAALHGYDITRRITYTVSRPIQGPSASAALTVALLAALRREPLRPEVVMTGTINPDGTIGPVSGVPAK